MLTILLAVALATAAPPAPARTLSGQVTDTTGAPLAQVRVAILEARRTAFTDLDGRYSLPGVPTGTHSVNVRLGWLCPPSPTGHDW
jgi:hypothetical protein